MPGHFLHSVGNFHLYDPVSKILYTGDLGAALGMEYSEVTDFDAHLRYMEGFHRRYMTGNRAMSLWANMVRNMDIEIIAPQRRYSAANRWSRDSSIGAQASNAA